MVFSDHKVFLYQENRNRILAAETVKNVGYSLKRTINTDIVTNKIELAFVKDKKYGIVITTDQEKLTFYELVDQSMNILIILLIEMFNNFWVITAGEDSDINFVQNNSDKNLKLLTKSHSCLKMAISPNRKFLAIQNNNFEIEIYALSSMKCIDVLQVPDRRKIRPLIQM